MFTILLIVWLFLYIYDAKPIHTVLQLLKCCWCWCESVHLIPMFSEDWPMSVSSVDGAVSRHLHSLPTITGWLGCPSFGCLAWDFWVCATHTLLQVIITCMVDSTQVHMHFNHINFNLLVRVRWTRWSWTLLSGTVCPGVLTLLQASPAHIISGGLGTKFTSYIPRDYCTYAFQWCKTEQYTEAPTWAKKNWHMSKLFRLNQRR
jgi:hypothetical protein